MPRRITLPSPAVRTVLPLALVTGSSMLAMDLILPAVPALQAGLGIDVAQAQATVSVFLAGLAGSQMLWGEALTHWGPRRSVLLGLLLLLASTVGCAWAGDLPTLLAFRALQGVAAGAATVVAPSVVRATLSDEDAVRGLAAIAMIESIVPAAGPVLGALLLQLTDWRGVFWLLALATLLIVPFVWRVTPRQLPGIDAALPAHYGALLRNVRYLRLAASHALCVGALLAFVASAPAMLARAFGHGPGAFAALQVVGVACFMAMASRAGAIAQRLGPAGAVRLGAWAQVALCAALWLGAWLATPPLWAVFVFWGCYCGALAVRGPAAFSEALRVPPVQMGRASALLVLALLLAGAAGTQLIAPFLDGTSIAPLAAGLLLMSLCSLVLVWRLGDRPAAAAGAD